MTEKSLLTPEQLRNLLDYDAETGLLFWKPRPIEMFKNAKSFKSWNTTFAGKEALTALTDAGYKHGDIFSKKYRAHRVIWAMCNNKWPDELIDHINGDRSDNRLCNLREATRTENNRNGGMRKNNTSGLKGVSWNGRVEKWRATIFVNRKQVHLGTFDCKQKAHEAYKKAAEKYHGNFSNSGKW